MNFDIERGIQKGTMEVIEAIGISPDATALIWNFLLSMDWTASISASYLALDHSLILSVMEPRQLNIRHRDGAWLRLIDVEKALAGRAFGPGADVVIEIVDDACPWNAGRWLVAERGATRTSRGADLRCAIDALACVYLGGFSWRQLAASSRAFAVDTDAITRADRVFEPHGAPWCPEIF